jgi:hypothetical protein
MTCAPTIEDVTAQLPRNPNSPNWRIRPLGAIKLIVVHYDAVLVPDVSPVKAGTGDSGNTEHMAGMGYDPVARYKAQAQYHIDKNWNEGPGPVVHGFGLMYHYRVSTDGRIWRTQPVVLVTWHARDANYRGLAVCCDLGSGQMPSEVQSEGLAALLDWLCYHRPDIPAGRADVWGHGELTRFGNSTGCPGGMLHQVQSYRKG